jgi:hypothetical protein
MASAAVQVARFEKSVRTFVRKTLLDFGRRFRARMMRERIGGGGSVLNVVTGKLKRSFRYDLVETARGFRIDGQIGGGPAPYAEDHEIFGRLEYENTFQTEAKQTIDEIRTGLLFFAKNPSAPVSFGSGGVSAVSGGADSARSALISEFKAHYIAKRAAAKLKRQSKWRSMRKGA